MSGFLKAYGHTQRLIPASLALGSVFAPLTAKGQFAGVVPEGVIAVVGAHRGYLNQTKTWNDRGMRIPLSSKAQLNFDGDHLLRGEGGAQLQSLAEELQRYDKNSPSDASIVRRLNLGTLNIGGQAKLNIQYLGLAFGLPGEQTLYVAAPVVDLQVTTRFALSGQNNATQIRDELGELAYDELKSGLTQAAQLSERDIKASIEAAQYTGVDSWRYRNFADIIFGYAFQPVSPGKLTFFDADFSLQTEVFATAPTGHIDNPDVLTDVSIGNGTWGLGVGLTPRLETTDLAFSVEANATGYLPSRQKMRVPVADETIVPASRRANVDVRMGASWEITAVAEGKFDWLQPQYRLMLKRHERDQLSGSIAGNYSALGNTTERTQFEHALWLNFSTIESFKRKEFPVPLRLKVAANHIFKGFNSFDETFFEVQLMSFLPTPWMPE